MTAETEANRQQLRALVRGAYDLQKLRMMMGARLYANVRSKLGLAPDEKEEDEEGEPKDAAKLLKLLKEHYRLLTEGIARSRTLPAMEAFKGDEIISTYAELVLVHNFLGLLSREQSMFRDMEKVLMTFPIYAEWMHSIVGVGPAMAGVMLSEIDIVKSTRVSNIWSYAGLDVAADGKGRSKRKEHLVRRAYTKADGTEAERDSITFNPFLKTKLVGVLSTSFLRSKSPYADIYQGYKHRQANHERQLDETTAWTKAHIHRAALRYMVKMFLLDLYLNWRKIEGLPVSASYHEDKLGHKHAA